VYICNSPLINSGGSHDTIIELEEYLSTVTFLGALGTVHNKEQIVYNFINNDYGSFVPIVLCILYSYIAGNF